MDHTNPHERRDPVAQPLTAPIIPGKPSGEIRKEMHASGLVSPAKKITDMADEVGQALGMEPGAAKSWDLVIKKVTGLREVLGIVSRMLGDPDDLYVAIKDLQAAASVQVSDAKKVANLTSNIAGARAILEAQDGEPLVAAAERAVVAKRLAQQDSVRIGRLLQNLREGLEGVLHSPLVEPERMEGWLIEQVDPITATSHAAGPDEWAPGSPASLQRERDMNESTGLVDTSYDNPEIDTSI